jgi:hypothetical protein
VSAIDDIDTINDHLADWIIHTVPAPGNVIQAQAMAQALSLHNQLDQRLTQIQLNGLKETNDALAAVLKKQGPVLQQLTAKAESTAKNISTVQDVIAYAAQAVAIAAQIVAVL